MDENNGTTEGVVPTPPSEPERRAEEEPEAHAEEVIAPRAEGPEPTTPEPERAAPQPGPMPEGRPVSVEKSKVVAGVLGILLGQLGVHKFYLGYVTEGIIMAAVSVLSFGWLSWIPWLVGVIEGVIYLTKTDEEFYDTYVAHKKSWF